MSMNPRPVIRPLIAAILAVVFLVGAGCGDDDDEPTTSGDSGTTTTAAAGGDEGNIVAADFSLTDITVAPGAPIALANEGDARHTATADGGEFDLGPVEAGETSPAGTAPDEPGDYPFHCEIHPDMTATLTVEG